MRLRELVKCIYLTLIGFLIVLSAALSLSKIMSEKQPMFGRKKRKNSWHPPGQTKAARKAALQLASATSSAAVGTIGRQ